MEKLSSQSLGPGKYLKNIISLSELVNSLNIFKGKKKYWSDNFEYYFFKSLF